MFNAVRKGLTNGVSRRWPEPFIPENRRRIVAVLNSESMAPLTHVPAALPALPPQTSRIARSLWGLMLVLCAVTAVYASTYFFYTPADAHFSRYILMLRLHIAGSMGAVLAGPWQFSQRLRTRALNVHRWMGRFYLVEVAVGSIGGFGMALVSQEGLPTHLGFGILAVLWLATGLQAYRRVRSGDIDAHRQWMIRNFALTLAAVTLRHYMPFMLLVLHWPFRFTYITVSWLCWVPNLLIAEWMVRAGIGAAPPRTAAPRAATTG
jgi:uncharacterized membrane protein